MYLIKTKLYNHKRKLRQLTETKISRENFYRVILYRNLFNDKSLWKLEIKYKKKILCTFYIKIVMHNIDDFFWEQIALKAQNVKIIENVIFSKKLQIVCIFTLRYSYVDIQ